MDNAVVIAILGAAGVVAGSALTLFGQWAAAKVKARQDRIGVEAGADAQVRVQEIQAMQLFRSDLMNTIASLRTEVQNLEVENRNLRVEIATLRSENMSLKSEITVLHQSNLELKQRLTDLENLLTNGNTSPDQGEA